MAAGYSGVPLPQKLGIQPGMTLAFLDAPESFANALGPLPENLRIGRRLDGHKDLVVLFVTRRVELASRVEALRTAIAPAGSIWVAWPKRASKVATDVTEDIVREVVLPTGLVDVKVAAIDATWSGLKLVIRKVLR